MQSWILIQLLRQALSIEGTVSGVDEAACPQPTANPVLTSDRNVSLTLTLQTAGMEMMLIDTDTMAADVDDDANTELL